MSGHKTNATTSQNFLGVQVTSSLYNTAIPLPIGMRRSSGRLIWYGYFRNGASGKKGKGAKKGITSYVSNLDLLLGFGPIWNIQSTWTNSNLGSYGTDPVSGRIDPFCQMLTQVYPVTSGSYTHNADGTYTYSNTVTGITSGWHVDFLSAISITPTSANSAMINDFGDPLSPRTITETDTEQWLYNTYNNFAGSGPGAIAWRPGSWALGKPLCNNGHCSFPIGTDHGDLTWSITLPAPITGNITVYFGETKDNHDNPLAYINYEFEPELGSGNEYNGSLSSQQIIYSELSGIGGVAVDLGASAAAPQTDVEIQGLYSLDKNGQVNPADFILDVILSGNIYFIDSATGVYTPLCFSHGLNFGGDPTRSSISNILAGPAPGTYPWPPQVVFPYVIPGRGLYQILKDPPFFYYGAYTVATAYPSGAIVSSSGVYYQYLGGENGVASAPPSAAWQVFTGSFSDGLTDVRNYCQANGILMSCLLQDQSDAAQLLGEVCQIANCAPVWNGQTLDFYPLSEASAIGSGYQYTPRPGQQLLIPTFNLDHYVIDGIEAPVTVKQTALQSVFNILDINYSDRGADSKGACGYASYQSNSVRICDVQHSQAYGPMNGSPLGFDQYICDATIATKVGWPIMKRQRYEDPYIISFKLPRSLGTLLDPMDTLILEEPSLFGGPQPGSSSIQFSGNIQQPVRIKDLEEDDAGVWTVNCERFIYGASVPSFPSVAGSTPNTPSLVSTPGGTVNAPYFFEPTNGLATALGMATTNGLGIAISCSSSEYGGCQVYCSTDGGSSYQLVGALKGSSVMGVVYSTDYPSHVNPDNTNTLHVDLTESDGELISWTTAQQNQLIPLAIVDGGGTGAGSGYALTLPYEVISYGTVTLSATSKYALAPPILRGQLGTVPADHPVPVSIPPNTVFVDLSDPTSVFKTVIPSGKILGNTLYFKFPTFNVWNSALQSLPDCTAYPFTLTGLTNPGSASQYSVKPSPCLSQGNQALGSGNNDATKVYFPALTVNYPTGAVSYSASSATAFSSPSGGQTVYVCINDPGQAGGTPTVDIQSTNVHATTPGYVFLGVITSAAYTGTPGSGTGGSAGGAQAGSTAPGGPQDSGALAISVNGVIV